MGGAAAKASRGRIKASKAEMEEWVSPSATVRRRRGFARGTDLDTIRRYEHTDMKLALGEIERQGEADEKRAEDVQMSGTLGTSFNLPAQYITRRRGVRSICRADLCAIIRASAY